MFKIVAVSMLSLHLLACSEGTEASEAASEEASVATESSTVVFARGSGGPVRTELGYGIVVNRDSDLQREWVVAQDTTLPARLDGIVGPRTVYVSERYSGAYQYHAEIQLQAIDSLSAVELRFVLFDIWGEFVRTLSMTEVEDIPAGATRTYDARWNLFSENEASEYYSSLGYIARVRTADGRVFKAAEEPIVEEARRLSERFSPQQLVPGGVAPSDSGNAATAITGA